MERATYNGFINVYITIPDLQVITTVRIGANPCFVMNSRPLITEIRQGHQVSRVALLAFGEIVLFHEILLPTNIWFFVVYTNQRSLTRASSAQPS